MQYPLKGLQGYRLQQLHEILTEISRRMGAPMGKVDLDAASDEIQHIQSGLPAKKLALEMELVSSAQQTTCHFSLVNNGNRDVEPLEVTVWFPAAIHNTYRTAIDPAILQVGAETINGVQFTVLTYCNHREPMMGKGHAVERLVRCLAPGMRSQLKYVFFNLPHSLGEHDLEKRIRYKIVVKNMKPVEGTISLGDKLS